MSEVKSGRSPEAGPRALRPSARMRAHSSLYLLLQGARFRPVGRFMRRLVALDRLSPEEFQRELDGRLQSTLERARRTSPWYSSERWENALRGHDPRDLGRWPVLERHDLSNHFNDLCSRLPGPLDVSRRSSATTGGPVRVAMHPHAAAWQWAWEYHVMKRHGVPIGAPTLVLWGGEVKRFPDWIRNRTTFSTTGLSPERLDAAARALLSGRFPVIWTYPSAAFQLARYVATHWPGFELKVPFIKVGGEPLFPFQRREIERQLGGRVINFYGASEVGPIAAECPAGAMHVCAENVHMEIFQGDAPAPPGVEGDVVLTALTNPLMPLVRYRIGDRARLVEGRCRCGWHRPVLEDIRAHGEEVVHSTSSTESAGPLLIDQMTDLVRRTPVSALRQVTFEQREEKSWTVVVEGANSAHPDLGQELRHLVRKHAGGEVDVIVKWQPMIPREASGKFRYYRSLYTPATAESEGAEAPREEN